MAIQRIPVASSMIKSVGHEGDTVEVEFTSGKVYRHSGCSDQMFAAMMASESIGKFYNAHIRNLPFEKAEEPKPEDLDAAKTDDATVL